MGVGIQGARRRIIRRRPLDVVDRPPRCRELKMLRRGRGRNHASELGGVRRIVLHYGHRIHRAPPPRVICYCPMRGIGLHTTIGKLRKGAIAAGDVTTARFSVTSDAMGRTHPLYAAKRPALGVARRRAGPAPRETVARPAGLGGAGQCAAPSRSCSTNGRTCNRTA